MRLSGLGAMRSDSRLGPLVRAMSMNVSRSSSRTIFLLLSLGLAFRLALVYLLFPDSRYNGDIQAYVNWALQLATVGPRNFYRTEPTDYLPGYLYVLWLVGVVAHILGRIWVADATQFAIWLIKIPPVLFDACSGFMLYWLAKNCFSTAHRESAGITAAAIYIFNPVTVYDSAVWGQTDAAGAAIILVALISLWRSQPEITASVAVLGAVVKPQFGVILLPLVGITLLRRHLGLYLTTRTESSSLPWLHRAGPVRVVTSMAAGALLLYVLITPFGLTFHSFLKFLTSVVKEYPYLTVNAFNPWALVGSDKPPLAFAGIVWGVDHWSRDDIFLVGSVTGAEIGTALLAVGFLVGCARLALRADRTSVLVVGAYLAMCFFILPTRVHERYLFTVLAFCPLLAAMNRRWLVATLALTIGFFINLHCALTVSVPLPFRVLFQSRPAILFSVLLQLGAFLFAIWSLRPKERSPQNITTGAIPDPDCPFA